MGSDIASFDETGFYIGKNRHWLHVAGTESLTYYENHEKRGFAAMEDIGILGSFSGRAIHDGLQSYFRYDCDHGLCNAHHLRELIFLTEEQNQKWSQEMIDCLVAIKTKVDASKLSGKENFTSRTIKKFEKLYEEILQRGYNENPLPPEDPNQKRRRGRKKQSKARNLLDRLSTCQAETLAFMKDFDVPFDNNLGERDIRMTKVQQKISGTFRSQSGADGFCRIRSYISTAKKNGINIFDAVFKIFTGNPFIPNRACI